MYDQYSFQVIPVMGQIIAGQWKPYQYLVESIRQFPSQVRGTAFSLVLQSQEMCLLLITIIFSLFQEDFKAMIQDAGFCQVTYENLSFGVVAIHSAFKL